MFAPITVTTNEENIRNAVRNLLTQGFASVNGTSCAYYDPMENSRCIIGHVMSLEDAKRLETHLLSSPPVHNDTSIKSLHDLNFVEIHGPLNVHCLTLLQNIHDLESPADWEDQFNKFLTSYNMQPVYHNE